MNGIVIDDFGPEIPQDVEQLVAKHIRKARTHRYGWRGGEGLHPTEDQGGVGQALVFEGIHQFLWALVGGNS